jgi:hypothetical protein
MNTRLSIRTVIIGLAALAAWAASLIVPVSVSASGPTWRAEYYNNTSLSGAAALVRHDDDLDFDWGTGSPDSRIHSDHFSARWTRDVHCDGGTYRFTTESDDGVRLYVDGRLVIDEWQDMDRGHHAGDLDLNHGNHTLRLEYYESHGAASVHLSWEETDAPASNVGNIITCVRPANSWIKVYRLDGSGWVDLNPNGFGPLNGRGDLKLDGMTVDHDRYGDAGHPYRVELWASGAVVRAVGDTGQGQPEFRVRANADNPTPWGCPAP